MTDRQVYSRAMHGAATRQTARLMPLQQQLEMQLLRLMLRLWSFKHVMVRR